VCWHSLERFEAFFRTVQAVPQYLLYCVLCLCLNCDESCVCIALYRAADLHSHLANCPCFEGVREPFGLTSGGAV
jgi:hypothetical protein